MENGWTAITPRVNLEAEFWEIANDFGDPLELLREAISNALDAKATYIKIHFFVEEIEGVRTLVIELQDDGCGMSSEVLAQDFWGLGFSRARGEKDKIGEKGHGTKIYLRSERVFVRTQTETGAAESACDRPMRALATRQSHSPRIREIPKFQEKVFGIEKLANFKVHLKCLGASEFEEISFGHVFPESNADIQKLFEAFTTDAGDWFCKRYIKRGSLEELPDVSFEAVISVEGDRVKRSYNPMIRERTSKDTKKYKVADRYGVWLCKDFIPIQQVNEWISGFGTGSNSFVLLHGFVNCQTLKLTANRGSIANTDPKVTAELQKTVRSLIAEIDNDLNQNGLYTLLRWQTESRTLEQEKAEFERRTKAIEKRKTAQFENRLFLEPRNESELFGLLIAIYSIRPDIFEFEPLDYNTTRGIDIIARNKTNKSVSESRFWYVELKYQLKDTFNHAFKNLRWIICWNFQKGIEDNSEFTSIEENDVRRLKKHKDGDGRVHYFLDNPSIATKIQIIPLKDHLKDTLGIEFK